MEDQTKKRSLLPILLVVIILGVILIISGNGKTPSPQPTDTPIMMVGTTTISGQFECLPHKDTSGPQTEECAFGLRDDSDRHYALDFSGTDVSAFDFPIDRPYRVTGLFTPIEMISSNIGIVYNIVGIVRVSSYGEVIKDVPVVSPSSTTTMELNKPVTD